MPFMIGNFYCGRGQFNCSATSSAPIIHIYRSFVDDLAAMSEPGYFPPYFGFNSEDVKDGDFFMVKATDTGGITYIITANPLNVAPFLFAPPGGMVSQTITTQSNEFTGIWASSQPVSLLYTQTNVICQFTIPTVLDSATTSSVITLTSPPFRFPGSDITTPIIVVDNGVEAQGKITFSAGGSFSISPLNGNFSGTGNSGFYGRTFSFNEFV